MYVKKADQLYNIPHFIFYNYLEIWNIGTMELLPFQQLLNLLFQLRLNSFAKSILSGGNLAFLVDQVHGWITAYAIGFCHTPAAKQHCISHTAISQELGNAIFGLVIWVDANDPHPFVTEFFMQLLKGGQGLHTRVTGTVEEIDQHDVATEISQAKTVAAHYGELPAGSNSIFR